MRVNFPPYSDFPADFQEKVVKQILSLVNRSENLQIVGLPGSGKTLLLSALAFSPQILKFHLKGEAKNYRFVYLDFNLVPEKELSSVLYFILSHLDEEVGETTNPSFLVKRIENHISSYLSHPKKKLIFIFDAFENLFGPSFSYFFKVVQALRDQHRYSINFIFALDREIASNYPSFLLSENLLYLPPSPKKDSLWFIWEMGKRLGIKIPSFQKEKILKLSGGFMRTIKRLTQALRSNQTLEEISQNPSSNIHFNYHFEQLLKTLQPEEETLRNLVLGKTNEADEKELQALRNLYVITPNNQFTSPLFSRFLQQKFGQRQKFAESLENKINLKERLTANEHRLLKYLLETQGEICSREKLIIATWGENALEVANHALDQLIHRLRIKLNSAQPPVRLETIRGRGHRLAI